MEYIFIYDGGWEEEIGSILQVLNLFYKLVSASISVPSIHVLNDVLFLILYNVNTYWISHHNLWTPNIINIHELMNTHTYWEFEVWTKIYGRNMFIKCHKYSSTYCIFCKWEYDIYFSNNIEI